MKIIEASVFFEKLLKETDSKREQKIFKNFIAILANLETRNFTAEELLSIEQKLKTLNLNSVFKGFCFYLFTIL